MVLVCPSDLSVVHSGVAIFDVLIFCKLWSRVCIQNCCRRIVVQRSLGRNWLDRLCNAKNAEKNQSFENSNITRNYSHVLASCFGLLGIDQLLRRKLFVCHPFLPVADWLDRTPDYYPMDVYSNQKRGVGVAYSFQLYRRTTLFCFRQYSGSRDFAMEYSVCPRSANSRRFAVYSE